MDTDLTVGWDPWTVMDQPIDEVRGALGIPPLP